MLNFSLERDLLELKQRLDLHGYISFEQYRPELQTEALASLLGSIEPIPGIPSIQLLTPKVREASTPNLYSGNFGCGMFPLHTDLAHWHVPPRYLLLRCLRPDTSAYTLLHHVDEALCSIPESKISRARFRTRAPIRGRTHLLPFRQDVNGDILHRWDSIFLLPDNDAAVEIAERLNGVAANRHVALHKLADTLLIDNWRVLHGRSSVGTDSQRVIERVYIRELHVEDEA